MAVAATVQAIGSRTLQGQEPAASGKSQSTEQALAARLAELQAESGSPGITAGIVLADGTTIGLAAGMADTARSVLMTKESRLLQGSVGKTYVSAVAMQLIVEGLLDLEAPVSEYLGQEPWFEHLPNHADITVRHIMTHTSGIVRYEFDERFMADLRASPSKVWKPVELLSYLFDTDAPFAPGEGWEYSDTNYILLGLIIERLTGSTYYEEMKRRLLEPLRLENTVPSDSRRIPGLVQGYTGSPNLFELPDEVLIDGEFVINPQFEWTGGGIASTAEDLARWARALYEGKAFDSSLLPVLLDGVPARLGPDTRYGLGVIIRPTRLGEAWGHSGFFPGYLTEVAYFPDHGFSVAVQFNSSDIPNLNVRPGSVLMALAELVVEMSK
jgi:D-alanyl-D-alanine carboxypeptidase